MYIASARKEYDVIDLSDLSESWSKADSGTAGKELCAAIVPPSGAKAHYSDYIASFSDHGHIDVSDPCWK